MEKLYRSQKEVNKLSSLPAGHILPADVDHFRFLPHRLLICHPEKNGERRSLCPWEGY